MNISSLPALPIASQPNVVSLIVKPIVYLIAAIVITIFAVMAVSDFIRRWVNVQRLPNPHVGVPFSRAPLLADNHIPVIASRGASQNILSQDRMFHIEYQPREFEEDAPEGRYFITLKDGEEAIMPADQIRRIVDTFERRNVKAKLEVSYYCADGEPHISADKGGLIRQYIINLFRAFKNDKTQYESEFILYDGRLIPQRVSPPRNEPIDESICRCLGHMVTYLMRQELLIGPIFHEATFAGILCLEEEERLCSFEDLSRQAKANMCYFMIRNLVESGADLKYLKPVVEFLVQGQSASERRISAVSEYYQNAGGDEKFLLSDGNLNLEIISKNREAFWNSCFELLMAQKTSALGTIEHALIGVHEIAKGMQEAEFFDLNPNIRLTSRGFTPIRWLNINLQGVIDRQIIVDKILCFDITKNIDQADGGSHEKIFECNEIVQQKSEWLKEWILRPETTDAQIENLLMYWTGSTVVDYNIDHKLMISPQLVIYEPGTNDIKYGFQPFPTSNTCAKTLCFSPEYFQDDDGSGLSDSTQEGFFSIIDSLANNKSENIWSVL